jgi:outer membrane protein TolC
MLALSASSVAQPRDTLAGPVRVEDVVKQARAKRSEIAAARARARASAQRPRVVQSLTDPMVMASVDHLPFSMMGADVSLTVQQEFPFSSVRSRRARVAEADARRDSADVKRITLDVELEAMNAFFMLHERRRMLVVVKELESVSRQLAAVSLSLYEAARGTQADALRADNEVSRLESERLALRAEVRAAEAMLNAAIGRDPKLPIPALSPPKLDRSPPELGTAIARALEVRPELSAMRHQKARALAEVDVMQSMYAPMGVVRAGPAYTMRDGMGVMFMVGVSVPIWRDRLDAGVDEANAMVRMASEDIRAMRNMIRGDVATSRAQVLAARVRLRTLRDRIVPTAKQTVDSALASYSAAQTTAVAVMEALRTLWQVKTEEVMAEARLGLAWAQLDRAMGKSAPQKRVP